MARHIEPDDETPADIYLQLQRERMAQKNFVTPAPLATRPQTVDVVPSWAMQAQPLDVGQAWQPMQGAKEASDPITRAQGLRIRLIPYVVLFALAGLVVGLVAWYIAGNAPVAAGLAVTLTAAAGLLTYRRMNLDDYDHSAGGVERLRITEAADLQREAMRHEQELKRMALESYVRRLERHE